MLQFFKRKPDHTPAPEAKKASWIKGSSKAIRNALLRERAEAERHNPRPKEIERYTPAPGVVPKSAEQSVVAQDATPYSYLSEQPNVENGFPGYPYLATLAQLPEYRKMVSTLAEECSREFIKITYGGDKDETDKIRKLESAVRKYKLRSLFKKVIEHDNYFGRGQLYIDVTMPGSKALASDDPKELESLLSLSDKKITQGSLNGFRVVEPIWTYPGTYNSTDPLHKDFYRPRNWYVMGKIVHTSRMLMFISRPVPDVLKAAYSFGGISLLQLAQPYVNHWIRTRDSVSDTVHSFSTSGILTNMEAALSGDVNGSDLLDRLQLFGKLRDNRGIMALDKDEEEFFQFNTPLSGLDALQAQAQEQMAAVSSIPLVKLLGITPTGLNASSDGEIRVFYDYVSSVQELYRDPIKRALDIIQLSEFGEIDPDIDFEFEPLYQLSELERAQAQQFEAQRDVAYVQGGVLDPEEVRTHLASQQDGPYTNIDLDERDEEDMGGLDPEHEQSPEEEGEPEERSDTSRVTKS